MFNKNRTSNIYQGQFGSCCKDLKHCMNQPNTLFHVSEDGSFFMTIGYIQTDEGTGWFDHAVIFCPFCGKQLQDRKELEKIAKEK